MPAHQIFTHPNTIGDLTVFDEGYLDNGDHVAVTTGTALAGFTTTPTAGNAAIVEANRAKTILMSFLLCEFRGDEDQDGKLDAVELWENAIIRVKMASSAPSLTQWGLIGLMFVLLAIATWVFFRRRRAFSKGIA